MGEQSEHGIHATGSEHLLQCWHRRQARRTWLQPPGAVFEDGIAHGGDANAVLHILHGEVRKEAAKGDAAAPTMPSLMGLRIECSPK